MDSISEILQGFEFAGAHTQTFPANTTKIEGGFSRLFQDLFGKGSIKTEYNKQKEVGSSKSSTGFSAFATNNDLTEILENRFRKSFTEQIKANEKAVADKTSQNTWKNKLDKKSENMAWQAKNTAPKNFESANAKPERFESTNIKREKLEVADKDIKNSEFYSRANDDQNTDQAEKEIDNNAEIVNINSDKAADPEMNISSDRAADPEVNMNGDKTVADSEMKVNGDEAVVDSEMKLNGDEAVVDSEINVNSDKTTADSEVENIEESAPGDKKNQGLTIETIEISATPIEVVSSESEIIVDNILSDAEKNISMAEEINSSATQAEQSINDTVEGVFAPILETTSDSVSDQQIINTDTIDKERLVSSQNIELKEALEVNEPQMTVVEEQQKNTIEKSFSESIKKIKSESITEELMKFAVTQSEKLLEEPEFRDSMVNLVDKIRELVESMGLAEQIETETDISADDFFKLLKDYFENPQAEKLANLEKPEFSQWHKLSDILKDYSVLQWSTESVETEKTNTTLQKISPELNPMSVTENMSAEDIAKMNAIARMTLKIHSESQETKTTKEAELVSSEPEIIKGNTEKQPDNPSNKRENHHNGSDFLHNSSKISRVGLEKTSIKFTIPNEVQNNPDKMDAALQKGRENNLSGIETTIESSKNLSRSTTRSFASESNLLVKQIMEQARKLNPPKLNTIRIILKPENLGQLRLSVSKETDGDGFRVRFAAESTAAKEMIERNIGQIRESLKSQGINANSIDVELNGENEKRNFSRRGARKKKWGKAKVETIETGAVKSPEAMTENIVNRYA